jgi:hypothetical protein
LYSFINKMVFSLEHDIKVTKSHQNLLPTQSVIVVHTVQYVPGLSLQEEKHFYFLFYVKTSEE